MRYLLDTSVYCQPLRRKPVRSVLLKRRDAGDRECGISAITVVEVEFVLELENREERWRKYAAILENRLEVFEIPKDVWHEFARRKARQHLLGQPVSDLDLLIAAKASRHHLTAATLNTADFARIEGVKWEDWSR